MTADDDDYVDAFKKAKLEHDQQRKGPTEVKRLQAEADADTAVLSNVVLPQLPRSRLVKSYLSLRHSDFYGWV